MQLRTGDTSRRIKRSLVHAMHRKLTCIYRAGPAELRAMYMCLSAGLPELSTSSGQEGNTHNPWSCLILTWPCDFGASVLNCQVRRRGFSLFHGNASRTSPRHTRRLCEIPYLRHCISELSPWLAAARNAAECANGLGVVGVSALCTIGTRCHLRSISLAERARFFSHRRDRTIVERPPIGDTRRDRCNEVDAQCR